MLIVNMRLFGATALVAVLCACATKREHYDTPEIPLPPTFQKPAAPTPETAQARTTLKPVLHEWWRLLGSEELNRLVDRALAGNHDLRIANLRAVQARARSEQAGGERMPTLAIPYSANNAAPKEGIGLHPSAADLEGKRTYQASVRASWRPDLWGELQAQYESAELQYWRAALARDDVQRALVANVVATYASYLSLSDRLRIAEESETLLSGLLNSVRDRMNEGDATVIDYEQQRSAVFQVRATIPQLMQQREQARNRLANLVGTVPGALELAKRGLDTLSTPVVSAGLPTSLLLQRPDVRSVEATMLAADANIDVARARMLPQFDISAQYGYGALNFSHLLNPANLFWNGIANFTATIFDSGKRARDVEIARALHEELVETYAQTLYNAVREVEDAQSSVASISQRIGLQQESVAAARSAWTYSRESYEAGAIDYLVLLDTERTYHARLDEFNRIRLESFLALVELFQAIGGGVDHRGILPGKGRRHLPSPGSDAGIVQGVLPPSGPEATMGPTDLVDGRGKRWLAELPGTSSHSAVQAARRDLKARLPGPLAQVRLLVRQERGGWYRLFAGAFDDEASARSFCAELRKQYMRCEAVANDSAALAGGGKRLQLAEAP
jgi:NodT family efflux transporter outer membrane factor (OMF) lipoprotein